MKPRMRIVCAFMTLILAAVPVTVCAQAYYVDSGASGAENGSLANPWNSLQDVNSHDFKPGDDLHFRCGGLYVGELHIDWSGTPSDAVIIGSYDCPGVQKPTLQGENGKDNVIQIDEGEHITIKDLSINGGSVEYGIHVWNTPGDSKGQIKISNVKINNLSKSAVYFHGIHGGTIENCTITASGDKGDAFGGGIIAAIDLYRSIQLKLNGNEIRANRGHGVRIRLGNTSLGGTPNCVISSNRLIRNGLNTYSASNIKISNADDLLLQSNLICCGGGENQNLKGLDLIRDVGVSNTKPMVVLGNMMSNCPTGVSIGISTDSMDSIKIFNNTMKGCGNPIKFFGNITGSEIKNNVFYQYDQQGFTVASVGGVVWDYNLWHPSPPAAEQIRGDNDVHDDPGFISGSSNCESNEAFRLEWDSPANGEGFDLSINDAILSQFKDTCQGSAFSWSGWCIGADCCYGLQGPILEILAE